MNWTVVTEPGAPGPNRTAITRLGNARSIHLSYGSSRQARAVYDMENSRGKPIGVLTSYGLMRIVAATRPEQAAIFNRGNDT